MKVFFDVITNHTADTVDYAEKKYGYRPKGAYPYLDKDGRPFDDRDAIGKVDAGSFPYTPVEKANTKVPAWLNDPTMYHNRGDSTWAGSPPSTATSSAWTTCGPSAPKSSRA